MSSEEIKGENRTPDPDYNKSGERERSLGKIKCNWTLKKALDLARQIVKIKKYFKIYLKRKRMLLEKLQIVHYDWSIEWERETAQDEIGRPTKALS